MRSHSKYFVVLMVAALLLTVVPTSMAEHNSVGFRLRAANAPAEVDGPDISNAELPTYHADFPAVARVAPADQTGLAYEDCTPGGATNPCYVGYIDMVFEHYVVLYPLVYNAINLIAGRDPLYRANPSPSDTGCDSPDERTNLDADCGQETSHVMGAAFDATVAVGAADPFRDQAGGSGVLYPGVWVPYVYIFGEGSSGIAAGGEEFPELPTNACSARTTNCVLLTSSDVAAKANAATGQTGAVCIITVDVRWTASSRGTPCYAATDVRPGLGLVAEYQGTPQSSTYIQNKPGWTAGALGSSHTVNDGADESQRFHTYVNPAPRTDSLWCTMPPVKRVGDVWQFDAHDFDMYKGPFPAEFDTVNPFLQPVIDAVNSADVDPVLDALDALLVNFEDELARVDMLQNENPEPQFPGDSTGSLTVPKTSEGSGLQCTEGGVLDIASPDQTFIGNVLNTEFIINYASVGPLRDPFALSDKETAAGTVPAPARDDESNVNPTLPGWYWVDGAVQIVEDKDQADEPRNGFFELTDSVLVSMAYDKYNPAATTSNNKPISDRSARDPGNLDPETPVGYLEGNGYGDPTGLYTIMLHTGPIAVIPDDVFDFTNFNARTTVLTSVGQNCVVSVTRDLTKASTVQGDKMRTLFGVASDADSETLGDAMCRQWGWDGSGDLHFMEDGFYPEANFATYGAGWAWVPLAPRLPGPSDNDALITVGLFSAFQTTDGTTDTKDSLQLGSFNHAKGVTPTLLEVWNDGVATYQWADVDLWQS